MIILDDQLGVAQILAANQACLYSKRFGSPPIFSSGWNSLDAIKKIGADVARTYTEAGGDADATPFATQRYVFIITDKREAQKAADGARYIRRIASAMRGKYGELEGAFLQETPATESRLWTKSRNGF